MNENIIISVITVCYNSVQTIEATILSVINQTYKNIEYIIIDGGSTDGTVEIINKYKDQIAYWISEPDEGIYDAMNKAVDASNGDWLFFINSGDTFYESSVLETVLKYMKRKNVIYYGNVLMLPDNIIYDGKFSKTKLCRRNICHQSIFYPKSVFRKYHYNVKYRIYADHFLNLECMADSDFSFKYFDEIISNYTLDGVSSVSPNDINFRNDYFDIIKSLFGKVFFLYSISLLYLHILVDKIRGVLK